MNQFQHNLFSMTVITFFILPEACLFVFSTLNESFNIEDFTFRDRAPTSPSREEVKAQAFERLQEELKKAQEVRAFKSRTLER